MRAPSHWAVAVRTPRGTIEQVAKPIDSVMRRHPVFRLPVIRGVIALGESLAIGFRALAISASYAAQQEGEDGEDVQTELSRGQLIFAFAIAICPRSSAAALFWDSGRPSRALSTFASTRETKKLATEAM